MKKTLVSALATALTVGAASVTFAAANPFEDVPADHWAYDAVAQLAKDGVVEGYGDGTYVGDAAITRYEMAQMVARAMTKSDLKHADKAMLDKLAAEFADELNNLGVRVAKLEKKVDNVKFYGVVRYQFKNQRIDGVPRSETGGNKNDLRIRLQMAAEVNEHWSARGRIEYITNMKDAKNTKDVLVNRTFMQGDYGNLQIKLGKFDYFTMVDGGMVFDDDLAGAQVEFGKVVKVKLMGGRYDGSETMEVPGLPGSGLPNLTMVGAEIYSDANKFTWGVGYHNISNKKKLEERINKAHMGIVSVGLGYKFNKDLALSGAYAISSNYKKNNEIKKQEKRAWHVTLNYKGATNEKVGSWGAHAAYRHLGVGSALVPTYDAMGTGMKGWEIGADYTLLKNVIGTLQYFRGKYISDGDGTKTGTLFGQLQATF